MFKTLIFVSAIVAVGLAETTFEQLPFGSESGSYNVSDEISQLHPVAALRSNLRPPDNGIGNYGDKLWGKRVQGDSLLTRQVLINDIAPGPDHFPWAANFPGKNITHVRFLNFGRERAWVDEIRCNGGPSAGATVSLAARIQCRLLVEVYGL